MSVFRRVGIAAPREAHVRLFVGSARQFMGLYTVVDAIDLPFLQRAFGVPDAYLYEYHWHAVLQEHAFRRRTCRRARVPAFPERTAVMSGNRRFLPVAIAALIGAAPFHAQAQVTPQRLQAAASEPQNWLTYSGGYQSQRYSTLDQITPANVKNLKLQWVYQAPVAGNWQTTPLVVDGVMYLTQRLNDVVALDATTGRAFWMYRYTPAQDRIVCCGANNRGLAILGNTLFMGTLDAQLIALDARTGRPIWKTEVATTKDGYSITHAPLVVKDKVIVGVGGGEYGIRGFIAAYDAATGKEAWRFYTVPAPGEPGSETWQACPKPANGFCDPDAWKHDATEAPNAPSYPLSGGVAILHSVPCCLRCDIADAFTPSTNLRVVSNIPNARKTRDLVERNARRVAVALSWSYAGCWLLEPRSMSLINESIEVTRPAA